MTSEPGDVEVPREELEGRQGDGAGQRGGQTHNQNRRDAV